MLIVSVTDNLRQKRPQEYLIDMSFRILKSVSEKLSSSELAVFYYPLKPRCFVGHPGQLCFMVAGARSRLMGRKRPWHNSCLDVMLSPMFPHRSIFCSGSQISGIWSLLGPGR